MIHVTERKRKKNMYETSIEAISLD